MSGIVFVLLLLDHAVSGNNQLEQLINFARGQGQPPPGRATAARLAAPAASPPAAAFIPPPIPFAELADPRRGVVPLDVPQPPPVAAPVPSTHSHREDDSAAGLRRNRFLPAGATQVGGAPLTCPKSKKTKPTPLSEIDPPIFLSTTFPHPLNDVAPGSAPLLPPPDALRHGLPAGTVPRPVAVPASALPEVLLLGSEQVGQRGVDQRTLNYDRFGSKIWQDTEGRAVSAAQLDGQHDPDYGQLHPAYLQADEVHSQALQRHRESLQKVLSQQRDTRPSSIPNANVPQQVLDQGPLSHFSIPGRLSLEAQQQELRLAQEALKRLG